MAGFAFLAQPLRSRLRTCRMDHDTAQIPDDGTRSKSHPDDARELPVRVHIAGFALSIVGFALATFVVVEANMSLRELSILGASMGLYRGLVDYRWLVQRESKHNLSPCVHVSVAISILVLVYAAYWDHIDTDHERLAFMPTLFTLSASCKLIAALVQIGLIRLFPVALTSRFAS